MSRPEFVRRSLTLPQLDLLASLLRLSQPTATAVRLVLIGGETHAAAGTAAGIAPPQVSRAIGLVRRLDAQIRKAYAPRQDRPQRARAGSDAPT